jgi:carnitine-CoA ligase
MMDPLPTPRSFDDDPLATGLDPSLVLPVMIRRWALEDPKRAFMVEVGGRAVSYGEFWDELLGWCTLLTSLGVKPGDRVASLLPASIDAQLLWLAASCIGAWEVAVNPDLRGELLRHVFTDSAPVHCFARPDTAHVAQNSGVDVALTIVPRGESFVAQVTRATLDTLPAPSDVSCVIYTSGTTGPAKGAIIPWGQLSTILGRTPRSWFSESDAVYAALPMFHVTGRSPTITMADVGGRVVFREKLSISEFWDDVRTYQCTSTTASGAALLLALPPSEDDVDNPLQIALFGALGPTAIEFGRRFGVSLIANYGSTEIGFPFTNRDVSPETCHIAGWLRPGYEARVVNSDGDDLPYGAAGELWIKPPDPLLMTRGYLNRPDATAKAIVDGWYHTGDAVILHESLPGRPALQFVDRIKDTVRRFGENISGSALETIINADVELIECAVLGVPSEVAGQEILLVVRPIDADSFVPETLFERLRDQLPKHCLPAYIALRADEFPKTPNGKIRKVELTDEIDRVASGQVWVSSAAVVSRGQRT